jgi:LPXTG-motif cell wall-anchored protein
MRRASAVVAATFVAIAGLAGPSVAAELPICGDGVGSGAIPGQTCEAAVEATAVCVGEDLVLRYAVTNPSSSASTVDVTWAGSTSAQPLSGDLPWPADLTSDATVTFGTTPEATTVTAAFRDCAEGDVSASGVLASTGSEASGLAIGAGALVVGGASLLLMRRARRAKA